ncbi:MAG TPA: hypothetical protein VMG82_25770 [Candidatus Sulfotelmatobacter sp.]|nr:hypothetical protein [Candidatus Sulfotelmatobacter sp.]
MRLQCLPLLFLLVVGTSMAQETSFAVGPQYLITTENTMWLRPIATPSMNLGGGSLAGTSEVPSPVEVPAFAPPETIVYLNNVYWGDHTPEEVFAQRLEPPSMTADQTAWYMNYVASQTAAATQGSYTGSAETAMVPSPSAQTSELAGVSNIIELTGGPMPTNLPASIFDPGVTGTTDPQSLQQRGLSLGEVAAFLRAHKRQGPRVFTNQDLRRK